MTTWKTLALPLAGTLTLPLAMRRTGRLIGLGGRSAD